MQFVFKTEDLQHIFIIDFFLFSIYTQIQITTFYNISYNIYSIIPAKKECLTHDYERKAKIYNCPGTKEAGQAARRQPLCHAFLPEKPYG